MIRIGVRAAMARFSELIRRAESGEVVVITRHGKAVVEFKPIGKSDRLPEVEPVLESSGGSAD